MQPFFDGMVREILSFPGTDSRLQPDPTPILGVAILLPGGDTSLIQLSARLPAQDRDPMPSILQRSNVKQFISMTHGAIDPTV